MDGSISAGAVIVCRVNGTSNLYVIGTVTAGTVGDLSLSAVTTMVGLASAIARGYRNRTPEERVWLFDGTASKQPRRAISSIFKRATNTGQKARRTTSETDTSGRTRPSRASRRGWYFTRPHRSAP
jgi:hypothetical protein